MSPVDKSSSSSHGASPQDPMTRRTRTASQSASRATSRCHPPAHVVTLPFDSPGPIEDMMAVLYVEHLQNADSSDVR